MNWLMRFGPIARLERDITRSLACRKRARQAAGAQEPTPTRVAALKGAATKRQQRRERDPLLSARGQA